MNFFATLVPNHLLTADVGQYPAPLQKYADQLRGRSMIVARAEMFPVECVVRGYISGSAWKEYKSTGRVCGIELPEGLRESDRLPEPIFTPSTKATSGHDENISLAEMDEAGGAGVEPAVARPYFGDLCKGGGLRPDKKALSLPIPSSSSDALRGASRWRTRCLRPDSSRFWPADKYAPGRAQESFDKQYVRDYLEEIRWNKQPPAPALPVEVAHRTSEKYVEAYRQLTGRELDV